VYERCPATQRDFRDYEPASIHSCRYERVVHTESNAQSGKAMGEQEIPRQYELTRSPILRTRPYSKGLQEGLDGS
jgi:hypothetical protein